MSRLSRPFRLAHNAAKARKAANMLFALKHHIGSMPVSTGIQLYMARVLPYLTRAADIAIDTDNLITELEAVEVQFLRRLLGVGPRCMVAPLYTETGLLPIRSRRILLALGRAEYTANMPDDRTVKLCMAESLDLWMQRKPSWAGDLANALYALPTPIVIDPADLVDSERIGAIKKEVVRVTDAHLQAQIDGGTKCFLLRGRVELTEEGRLDVVIRRRRHYLTQVTIPAHRKALTRLLLTNHSLSVEVLRYPQRDRAPVPRERRLCRMCRISVEDETHVLYECEARDDLVRRRELFLHELFSMEPLLRWPFLHCSRTDFFRQTLASRKAVNSLAQYVHETMEIVMAESRYYD